MVGMATAAAINIPIPISYKLNKTDINEYHDFK